MKLKADFLSCQRMADEKERALWFHYSSIPFQTSFGFQGQWQHWQQQYDDRYDGLKMACVTGNHNIMSDSLSRLQL